MTPIQLTNEFVNLVEDLLEKQEKSERHRTSMNAQAVSLQTRKVKTWIASFRIKNNIAKRVKKIPRQGGLNFLAL